MGMVGLKLENCHFFQGNQGQLFQFCTVRIPYYSAFAE